MPVLEKLEQRTPDDPEYLFHCPGCGYGHWFKTTGKSPVWTWNGSLDKPTLSPSLMVRGKFVCHSFVRDGQMQFLSDCTHALAGQTVPIPEDD